MDGGPSNLTLLVILNGLPAGLYYISARTTSAFEQKLLWYSKALYSGDVIENKHDAQGLNYFGNNVWGAEPLSFIPEHGKKKLIAVE